MDGVEKFVDECLLIDDLGFVMYDPVLASSSLDVPSAVHHAIRMSCRRLHVIIFVSLVEFMIMFMICVARSDFDSRRRLLHHVRAHARQPIRLVHSLLFLLLSTRCLSATPCCQISVIRCLRFMLPIKYHLSVFQSVSYHYMFVIL